MVEDVADPPTTPRAQPPLTRVDSSEQGWGFGPTKSELVALSLRLADLVRTLPSVILATAAHALSIEAERMRLCPFACTTFLTPSTLARSDGSVGKNRAGRMGLAMGNCRLHAICC